MINNARISPFPTNRDELIYEESGATVSTRTLLFTAWTAAALFGQSLYQSELVADSGSTNRSLDENLWSVPEPARKLDRFRRVTERLALTKWQELAIDECISHIQPVLVQLQTNIESKQQRLAGLEPGAGRYLYDTGRLANGIGTLATQIALTASKLRQDVYGVLTAEQQALMGELQSAFLTYK